MEMRNISKTKHVEIIIIIIIIIMISNNKKW